MHKRFVCSSYKIKDGRTLKEWAKTLPEDVEMVYVHLDNGDVIGQMPLKEALRKYGDRDITSAYQDNDTLASVWIKHD